MSNSSIFWSNFVDFWSNFVDFFVDFSSIFDQIFVDFSSIFDISRPTPENPKKGPKMRKNRYISLGIILPWVFLRFFFGKIVFFSKKVTKKPYFSLNVGKSCEKRRKKGDSEQRLIFTLGFYMTDFAKKTGATQRPTNLY